MLPFVFQRLSTAPLLLLLLVQTLLLLQVQVVQGQCTICSDGTTPTGSFGGIPCDEFEADLATVKPNSDLCLQMQLEAFQACNCPEYPVEEYCPLCADGFFNIANPKRPIVIWKQEPKEQTEQEAEEREDDEDGAIPETAKFVQCQDVLFGDRSVEGECERYASAAYYCGCPQAVAPAADELSACPLCPEPATAVDEKEKETTDNGSGEAVSTQQYGEGFQVTRKVPPLFHAVCDDYRHAAASFFTSPDDCPAGHAAAVLEQDLPVHLAAYCGCQDMPISSNSGKCQLCPGGSSLVNKPNRVKFPAMRTGNSTMVTCEEWAVVALHVKDGDEYCQTDIVPARETCCVRDDPSQPFPPAPAPVPAPEDGTSATAAPTSEGAAPANREVSGAATAAHICASSSSSLLFFLAVSTVLFVA